MKSKRYGPMARPPRLMGRGRALESIEAERVRLENDTIDADTIILAAGIVRHRPERLASAIPVVRDQRGRISVDVTMRSRSHPQVWSLGDCAPIPAPDGRPYPALAQQITASTSTKRTAAPA